jgi:hypothetical protein
VEITGSNPVRIARRRFLGIPVLAYRYGVMEAQRSPKPFVRVRVLVPVRVGKMGSLPYKLSPHHAAIAQRQSVAFTPRMSGFRNSLAVRQSKCKPVWWNGIHNCLRSNRLRVCWFKSSHRYVGKFRFDSWLCSSSDRTPPMPSWSKGEDKSLRSF